MGRKLSGCAPLGDGELGPHLRQCGEGRGLPAYQVSSWPIQPFGHSTPTSQTGQTGRSKKRRDDRTLSRPQICKLLYGPSQGDETGDWTDDGI